jgi:Galactosyltransferase
MDNNIFLLQGFKPFYNKMIMSLSTRTRCPYILLIMNCYAYSHKSALQRETWLQHLPPNIIYYHVVGDPNLCADFEFVDDDPAARVLIVKTCDDYNSLPKKVIAAYSAVNETFDYDYIFKTDDDQDLVNPRFFSMICNIISTREPKVHYAGNVVNVKTPYVSKYYTIHPELPSNLLIKATVYCSGRFYLLSEMAVEDLLQRREEIEGEYLEDYAIGLYLSEELKQNGGLLHIPTSDYFCDC